mgnify:CR=1 FL=1
MNFIRKIVTQSSKGDDKVFYNAMRNLLKFKPYNIENYQKAFTHRSLKKVDKKGEPFNYERLEFVGDAMLGAVIASYLFTKVPNQSEGYLTQMRSKIVSREHLNELGKELKLINHVESNISNDNFGDNNHGNLFEALIGAIYLDRGYHFCEKFIFNRVIIPHVDIEKLEGKISDEDYKKTKDELEFIHTENFILVDKKGRIRGVYNGTLVLDIQRLQRHIELLKLEY